MSNFTPNLRALLTLDNAHTYVDFCREERNYAALLYRELLTEKGLRCFLEQLPDDVPADLSGAEVFFEYAHARDLWAGFGAATTDIDHRNRVYRSAIEALIAAPPGLLDSRSTPEAFNRFFIGDSKRASKDHIRMPNQWDQKLFDDWIAAHAKHTGESSAEASRQFARRVCRLKWAFNAKADIVIHLPGNRAVCVEIKVASKESSYKVCGTDASGTGSFVLKQTELQRYVLKELLGYQTRLVFLSPGKAIENPAIASDGTSPVLLGWNRLMQKLRGSAGSPTDLPFVDRMLRSDALGAKVSATP